MSRPVIKFSLSETGEVGKTVILRRAIHSDFSRIAQIIVEQSSLPECHCIQSDTGSDDKSVYQEIVSLDQDAEVCFVVAVEKDDIVGLLGCEFDESSGRGWLRGPFVLRGDWSATAEALLQRLRELLPSSIYRLDSFLNIANERGNTFYLDQQFRQVGVVHVYTVSRPDKPQTVPTPCTILTRSYEPSFVRLHDDLFSSTYITGSGILDQIDEDHRVFICSQGEDQVQGYLYAAVEPNTGEGYIEFLGVQAEARRRGVGRQLLQTALSWFFNDKGVAQVSLSVEDGLDNARSLYEKVGFRLQYTGVNCRREWL